LRKNKVNQGNLDAIDEGLAPDFVNHDAPPGLPSDREGFKQLAVMYKAAFPDMHLHVEDQLAEGDMVVSRWSIAPTGKEVTVTGIDIDRFEGGQIVET
jgi:predicted ester cyclase